MRIVLLFLLCPAVSAFCARVDTVKIESKSMEKTIPNLVIVPDNYGNQQAQYSVLYLLHGAYGDHTDWLTKYPAIKSYADTYNLIIVCPNGGYNSWYVDSPIDETMNYETYVAIELVEAIDDRYNTVKDKAGRAITGLSMGGHGAFYLAFRHQDIWGAAGSMSGGMDLRPFPKNWDIPKRLGDYANHKDNWEQSSVVNLIYLLDGKELALIFDCGTDDFFFGVNQRMHQKLLERNIPHDYIERPGDHNWDYWGNAIRYQLLFFSEYFQG